MMSPLTVKVQRVGLLAVIALFIASPQVSAHHGWGWATDEEFEITGTIIDVKLGNPHGEVTIDAGGERWIVEVGQPYRNQAAGLKDGSLRPGVTVKVHGHRSAREGERLVKAERVVIGGTSYDLYPDRES